MDKKALFLRLSPKKVDLISEKVDSVPKKFDSFSKKVDLSVYQQNHPITLKHFKLLKLFSTQNLHIRKFCCTFAADSYAGGKYVLRKAFRNGSFLG